MVVRKRGRDPSIASVDANGATAIALLTEIEKKRLDPVILTTDQRRACIAVVANGHHTQGQLAHLFKVCSDTIRNDLKRIREQLGEHVREWSLDYVLGDLAMTADRCSAMAFEQADPGLAWKIKSEMVKHLQSLGVIGERKDQDGIRITVEAIGQGYGKLRETMAYALDPVLSGEEGEQEVIDVLALPLKGKSSHKDEGHEHELEVDA